MRGWPEKSIFFFWATMGITKGDQLLVGLSAGSPLSRGQPEEDMTGPIASVLRAVYLCALIRLPKSAEALASWTIPLPS